MMNKLSILFVLLFGILTVKAQSYKIYIDNYGAKADSINAKSYMVVTRVSDTDWLAKQYLMNNIIKCLGTYKDQNLTTPNGKFNYYNQNKSQGVDAKNADTINYVQMSGYFIDGLKTGTWTTYFKNGNIEYINNYKNDKLNGLYESYNYDSNTILIKGYYADNKRNGEWDTFNPHGDIIEANIIKDDNRVSSHTVKISYIGAEPRYGLYDYLDKNLKSLVSSNYGGKISVGFQVAADGKIENPRIIGDSSGDKNDNELLNVIKNGLSWKPAYNKTAKEYVESTVVLNIVVSYGKMIVSFRLFDEAEEKMYQLTH